MLQKINSTSVYILGMGMKIHTFEEHVTYVYSAMV
jgi:hypothetical protein